MSGTNFRGGRKPFPKPSAFESEIHPMHKPSVYAPGISPCRGQIRAGANLQSERAGLYLSTLSQKTGRMDAVAANGYILEQIRSNIYGTSQKSLAAVKRWQPWIARKRASVRNQPSYDGCSYESGGTGLYAKGKEKGIREKKFIYRNSETA